MVLILLILIDINLQEILLTTNKIQVEKRKTQSIISLNNKKIVFNQKSILFENKIIFDQCVKTQFALLTKRKWIRSFSQLELFCDEKKISILLPNWIALEKSPTPIPLVIDKRPIIAKNDSTLYVKILAFDRKFENTTQEVYTPKGLANSPPLTRGLLWKKIHDNNPCHQENFITQLCVQPQVPICVDKNPICL